MEDICSVYVLNINKLLNQQNMVPQFIVGSYITYIVHELNSIFDNINMKRLLKSTFSELSSKMTLKYVFHPVGHVFFFVELAFTDKSNQLALCRSCSVQT